MSIQPRNVHRETYAKEILAAFKAGLAHERVLLADGVPQRNALAAANRLQAQMEREAKEKFDRATKPNLAGG